MTLDRQIFINWQQNPVTKTVMQLIRDEREDCLRNLSNDTLMFDSKFPLLAAKWATMIAFYDNWLNVTYKEIKAVYEEGENDE